MKPMILLIEDSKTHLNAIVNFLNEFGFSAIHASTAEEGIRLAKNHKPDLILLDLALPGTGGLEVCQLLKLDNETKKIPIIILTQKRKIEDKMSGFKAGAQDYLTKPYHPDELKARIQTALRIKEEQDLNCMEIRHLETLIHKIQTLAATDSLTNLLNRPQFMAQLRNEFIRSQRYHLPLTLCLVDIDHLKTVNQKFGEPAGDVILIDTASLLQQNFREIDSICRFENDNFLIGLPHSPLEDALTSVNRFQRQISQHTFKGIPSEFKITVSIGIVSLPNPNLNNEKQLIEAAQKALLKAKENGENRIATGEEK